MAKNIHKGTELSNVSETWEQNERNRQTGSALERINTTVPEEPSGNRLDLVIREEAAEYDAGNKEERLLSGDRATLNDDDNKGSDQ